MKLIKMTFIEDAGLNDQYIRSFEYGAKEKDVKNFVDLSREIKRYNPSALADVAHSIIRPSNDRTIISHAPGGWGAGRFMFSMVIETSVDGYSKEYQYITGFTDRKSVSGGNGKRITLDREMRMYINTNTRVHLTDTAATRNRTVWQPKLMAHDQIVRKRAITGDARNSDLRPVLQRPMDLFKRAGSEHAFGEHLSRTSLTHENTIGRFSSEMKASTRLNNNAANILSRGLNAYIHNDSNPQNSYVGESDLEDVLTDTTTALLENDLATDKVLSDWASDSNILRSGYITYDELLSRQDAYFDEDRVVSVLQLGERIRTTEKYRNRPGRENQSHWDDGGATPMAASIIAQTLPSLMLQCSFSSVEHLIINTRARTQRGDQKVVCTIANPYIDGFKPESTIDYFEELVEDIIVKQISQGGRLDIDARIHANIDTDIEITISVENEEDQYFLFPVYMDGLLAPTLDEGTHGLETLASGIVNLSAATSRQRHRDNPTYVTEEPGINLSTDLSAARRDRDQGPTRERQSETSSAIVDLTGATMSRVVRDI